MKYRILALEIDCVRRGPNGEIMPNLKVTRPTVGRGDTVRFTDSDEEPTLITFDKYCQVDIPMLLAAGAVEEWEPPAKAVPAKKEGS